MMLDKSWWNLLWTGLVAVVILAFFLGSPEKNPGRFPAVVDLNVGGHLFTTRLATLTSDPDSMLTAMFSGRHVLDKDSQGNVFLDRQGELFQHVLNFLRDGSLPPPFIRAAIIKEAQYYQIKRLVQALEGSGVFAEQRVRETLVKRFPPYSDVKKRLPQLAEQKAVDLNIDNVGVTMVISELWSRVEENDGKSWVLMKNSQGEEKKVYLGNVRDSFLPWSESKHYFEIPVEEMKIDVKSDEQNNIDPVQLYTYKISCLLTNDLVKEGFKVKFMQPHWTEVNYIVEKTKTEYMICRSEVTFHFNFASYDLNIVTKTW